MKATRLEGYKLFHEGCIALAQIEENGMRIDTKFLNKALDETSAKIKELEAALRKDEIYKMWKKRFGDKANLGSHQQLGKIIFGEFDKKGKQISKGLGYERKESTAKGITEYESTDYGKYAKRKNDEMAFDHVDLPFVKMYFKKEKLNKANGTYLEGIRKHTVDGRMHPFFNLHTTKFLRSSSDRPNFQNIPVRNPEIAELIRKCFIPDDDDSYMVENDFGGIEVRVVACYNKDPLLIKYLKEGYDFHKEYAALCYKADVDKVTKDMRYNAKNKFVFPTFYGSYYCDTAKALWEALDSMKLAVEGLPLKVWLKQQGISSLGACDPNHDPRPNTFERHIKRVEDRLWNKFHVYEKWRKDWWNGYKEKGYIDTYTGFRIVGIFKRNQIFNSPIQGSAFHILLKSLILLNRWMKKKKMRSKIVGQIHDSIIASVHKDELDDYLYMVKRITTVEVPKLWQWIIVPMEIEAEAAPLGKSWYFKKKVEDF